MDQTPELFKRIVDDLPVGVYMVDHAVRITYWNRGAEQISGYGRDEVMGTRCADALLTHLDEHGRPLCNTELCPAAQAIQHGASYEGQLYLQHREGHRVPVRTSVTPIRGPKGEITGVVEVFCESVDETVLAKRIQTLERLALLDPLTEVGNRRFGEMHLEEYLSRLERHGGPIGLLMLDIDRFKAFNDTYEIGRAHV